MTPYSKRIGGGCHVDRKMDDLIRTADSNFDVGTSYMTGPKRAVFKINTHTTKSIWRFGVTLAQQWRDRGTELQHPSPHRFVGDVEPSFGQQLLHIAVAQGERR